MSARAVMTFAALAVAALLSSPLAAQGLAQDQKAAVPGPTITSKRFSTEAANAAARELTPSAMLGARPTRMPSLTEEEFRRRFPGAKAPSDQSQARLPIEIGVPVPGNINSIPLRWAGKLFTKMSNSGPGMFRACSAQFIHPHVILTAAHCVTKDDSMEYLSGPFIYARQYQNGIAALKIYPITCVAFFDSYNGGNYAWDYVMLKTNVPSSNGYFGWNFNWYDDYLTIRSIGYPSAIDSGQQIQVVTGSRGSFTNGIVELLHGVDDFTYGASGGAWVGNYANSGGEKNYVLSVNSFILTNKPGRMYGPYFDGNFPRLLNFVKNDCR